MENTQEIYIANAPEIPGLRFRGFHGEADFPAMAAIITAANKADQDDESVSVEEIAANYKHMQRSDTARDMVFIEIGGKLVSYGRCWWDQESEGSYIYSFFLHISPEWRGMGLERPVVDHFLHHLGDIAKEHQGSSSKLYQTWSSIAKPDWNQLLEQIGFEPVRYTIGMVRPGNLPLERAALPEGVEIRPVQQEHMRQIFDAEKEAFLDHFGTIVHTEEDYQYWVAEPHQDPKLWKVAWDGDQVVGMVRNYINQEENKAFKRKRGYTDHISVRRPWRRIGVARALLTESIQMFMEMGMEDTTLGVDTQNSNGAHDLYTGLGYQEVRRFINYRKTLEN